MILLWVQKVSEDKSLVVGEHNAPFDSEFGIRDNEGNLMTQEELEAQGAVFVDSLLQPEDNGMQAIRYVDLETKEQWFEYVEIPKSEIELLRERVESQEQAIFELAEIISMGGMNNG